jgi:hypothetical protein
MVTNDMKNKKYCCTILGPEHLSSKLPIEPQTDDKEGRWCNVRSSGPLTYSKFLGFTGGIILPSN